MAISRVSVELTSRGPPGLVPARGTRVSLMPRSPRTPNDGTSYSVRMVPPAKRLLDSADSRLRGLRGSCSRRLRVTSLAEISIRSSVRRGEVRWGEGESEHRVCPRRGAAAPGGPDFDLDVAVCGNPDPCDRRPATALYLFGSSNCGRRNMRRHLHSREHSPYLCTGPESRTTNKSQLLHSSLNNVPSLTRHQTDKWQRYNTEDSILWHFRVLDRYCSDIEKFSKHHGTAC